MHVPVEGVARYARTSGAQWPSSSSSLLRRDRPKSPEAKAHTMVGTSADEVAHLFAEQAYI